MSSSTRDELRDRLQTWYQLLFSWTDLRVGAEDLRGPDRTLWIEVSLWPGYKGDDNGRMLLEALELIAHLARVDWELWRQMAKSLYPTKGSSADEALLWGPFNVRVDVTVRKDTIDAFKRAWAAYRHSSSRSKGFMEFKTLMDELRRGSIRTVPMRLTWREDGNYLFKSTPTYEVLQLVVSQRSQERQEHKLTVDDAWFGCLSITEAKLADKEITKAATLDHLITLGEAGVSVVKLGYVNTHFVECNQELYKKVQWSLWGVGKPIGDAPRAPGAAKICIDWIPEHSMVASVFLALRASQSVEKVSLLSAPYESASLCSESTRGLHWPWLAYSLFCRERGEKQSLKHVQVHVTHLLATDVVVIAQLLKAPCPLAELLKHEGWTGNAAGAVDTIAALRFSLHDPAIDQSCVLSDRVVTNVPVLSQSGDWLTVLLPCWGRAWVHQRDVASSHTATPPHSHVVCSVPNLALMYLTDESMGPTLDLLRIVGQELRHLDVRVDCCSGIDAWCQEVLKICPLLESFGVLCGDFDSVDVFVDGYESGTCRLQRLALRPMTIRDANASMTRLFEALSDPHHSASSHLEQFVYYPRDSLTDVQPQLLGIAKRMLEQNLRLREFEFQGRNARGPSLDFGPASADLNALNRTKVPIVGGAVEKRQKLAFLSAISRVQGNRATPCCFANLDAVILNEILTFVGTWCVRHVDVHVSKRTPWE